MDSSQPWFLVWEVLDSEVYNQVFITLEDVKQKGLTLPNILEILGLRDSLDKYGFFIHSGSMSAAVQILNDQAVLATWSLYCRYDPVVTIIVRKVNDPSPNSSRAPSYSKALSQRRSASGKLSVPDIPVHTPSRNVSFGQDPVHLEPIIDLPEHEKVILVNDQGEAQAFGKEYLLCWINSQLQDRRMLTDIKVETLDGNGQMISTLLTRSIWERSLIRGPWKLDFAPLWEQHIIATDQRHATIAELRETHKEFTQSCINFIHDLRTFSGDRASRTRLDSTGHEFFLGKPYFTNDTVDKILQLKTGKNTVEDELRALVEKRMRAEICAAHDLSPFFESVLGIAWDKERQRAISMQEGMKKAEISSESSMLRKLAHKSSKILMDTFSKKGRGGRGSKGGRGGSSSGSRA